MTRHITVESLDDIDLDQLNIGDTVTVTKGEHRFDKEIIEFPITYRVIGGEIAEEENE